MPCCKDVGVYYDAVARLLQFSQRIRCKYPNVLLHRHADLALVSLHAQWPTMDARLKDQWLFALFVQAHLAADVAAADLDHLFAALTQHPYQVTVDVANAANRPEMACLDQALAQCVDISSRAKSIASL
jgi:hypothetical protein